MRSLTLKTIGVVAAVLLLAGCSAAEPSPKPVETTKAPTQTPKPTEPAAPSPEPAPAPEMITVDNFYDICVAQLTYYDYIRTEDPVRAIAAESDSLIVQRPDGMVIMAAPGHNEFVETTLMCGAKGTVDAPEWHQFGASIRMTDEQIQERIELIGHEAA